MVYQVHMSAWRAETFRYTVIKRSSTLIEQSDHLEDEHDYGNSS